MWQCIVMMISMDMMEIQAFWDWSNSSILTPLHRYNWNLKHKREERLYYIGSLWSSYQSFPQLSNIGVFFSPRRSATLWHDDEKYQRHWHSHLSFLTNETAHVKYPMLNERKKKKKKEGVDENVFRRRWMNHNGQMTILSDGEGFISRFAIWIEMEILSPLQFDGGRTPHEREVKKKEFCQRQSRAASDNWTTLFISLRSPYGVITFLKKNFKKKLNANRVFFLFQGFSCL